MSTHRVNVNFSESAWRDLREIAERRGKTVSDVLRDSIALSRWWQEQIDEGHRILLERDGNVREVIAR